MVAILDNIRSLHNVGSIFRTSDAVGVEKIYLCGITPSPLDRFGKVRGDVAKTALGAEQTVAWEMADTTAACIERLKKQGFQIIALEQSQQAVSLYSTGLPRLARNERVALILGAEVDGISPEVLAKCDTIIEIPMVGTKESLNVSVAFGIAAFHLTHG